MKPENAGNITAQVNHKDGNDKNDGNVGNTNDDDARNDATIPMMRRAIIMTND